MLRWLRCLFFGHRWIVVSFCNYKDTSYFDPGCKSHGYELKCKRCFKCKTVHRFMGGYTTEEKIKKIYENEVFE